MNSHTPGPWRVRNAGERRKTIVEADQGGIAHVIKQGLPTDAPNARLIAAAPELLAALEALMQKASLTPREIAFAMARAAIRKARGEEQA